MLEWDKTGKHFYETGVSKGVLYKQNADGEYVNGVVWNGLTAVTEQPSGAEATPLYADNIKYLNLFSAEEFSATIEAYMYPDEFALCNGEDELATGVTIGQQNRETFGMSYQTKIGNDVKGQDLGYKIHLIYGAKASPSEKAYQTINDNPEAITFSFELTTTPVAVSGFKPTANLTVDSTKVTAASLKQLEAILYGVDAPEFDTAKTYELGDYVSHESKIYVCIVAVETPGEWDADNWSEVTNPGPRLPLPDEVATLFASERDVA